MLEKGAVLEERDLGREPLSVDELDRLIGSRDHREFLNPRNELFKEMGMKDRPPPRAQALRLMAENPNLIRRPIVVSGAKIVIGFDEKLYKEL